MITFQARWESFRKTISLAFALISTSARHLSHSEYHPQCIECDSLCRAETLEKHRKKWDAWAAEQERLYNAERSNPMRRVELAPTVSKEEKAKCN